MQAAVSRTGAIKHITFYCDALAAQLKLVKNDQTVVKSRTRLSIINMHELYGQYS